MSTAHSPIDMISEREKLEGRLRDALIRFSKELDPVQRQMIYNHVFPEGEKPDPCVVVDPAALTPEKLAGLKVGPMWPILPRDPGSATIPANCVESVKLILKECVILINGHAGRMEAMEAGDWKAQTAANLSRNFAKKLTWVHQLVEQGVEPAKEGQKK